MIKNDPPIPIHQLAFLQAYLYEIFNEESKCENSFKHTEWYLKENFSQKEIESTIIFLKGRGLSCDCDIIKKLDLKDILKDKLNFHD